MLAIAQGCVTQPGGCVTLVCFPWTNFRVTGDARVTQNISAIVTL